MLFFSPMRLRRIRLVIAAIGVADTSLCPCYAALRRIRTGHDTARCQLPHATDGMSGGKKACGVQGTIERPCRRVGENKYLEAGKKSGG